ncbi:MAG: MarR family transcriptional regulator [Acidimicrobiales bacterium]
MQSQRSDLAIDALLKASRVLVAVAARSLADVANVTLPQFRALVVLNRPSPVTVKHLAHVLDVHPSTATRLCDRLVRKGLIRRLPAVAPDRRETTLILTARGRRLVEGVTERRRRDLGRIAARMTVADRRHVVLGLRAFAAAAGAIPGLDPFAWFDDRDGAIASPKRVGYASAR